MVFDSWYDLVRVLVVGTATYVGLILLLRTTGKRTLSKMNAFDLVVTVALGSTLASSILSSDVSISEGLLAFALLCLLQFVVAWLSVRSERFRDLIKAEPTLLFHRGRYLPAQLRRERVTREEVLAAVRSEGNAQMEDVEAVVLETDGSLSVIRSSERPADTLQAVEGRKSVSPEGALASQSA